MKPHPLLIKLQQYRCDTVDHILYTHSFVFFTKNGATDDEAHTLVWELYNVYGIDSAGVYLQYRNGMDYVHSRFTKIK